MVSKKRNSFPMMKPFWNYIINKRHDKKRTKRVSEEEQQKIENKADCITKYVIIRQKGESSIIESTAEDKILHRIKFPLG